MQLLKSKWPICIIIKSWSAKLFHIPFLLDVTVCTRSLDPNYVATCYSEGSGLLGHKEQHASIDKTDSDLEDREKLET